MASIRKRTWTTKGVEQTAWVVDYFDQAGKRRLKTFPTKRAAESWSVTALHEVKQGVHTPSSTSKTVEEGWDLWLEDCEANDLERGTVLQRRQHLNLHVKPFLGRAKLSELTTPGMHQFDAELRKAGRSLSMRRKVLSTFKTMLTFCQAQGLVAQNVARAVRLKNDDRQATTGPVRAGVDFPTKAELKQLIDNAPARWRPFMVTAIFTGMRPSELRGLPWRDVDLDAGVIHVRQRADRWGQIGPPKSKAGKRDIPLAPIVVNTLRQWKQSAPKADDMDDGEQLVFPNGNGNVESLTNISKRVWWPLQEKCGLAIDTGEKDADGAPIFAARYEFKMLRHAAASLFIQHLGWTPKRVQVVMGHSSIKMTFDLYGHLFESTEADRADMAKIEAAIHAA